MITSAYAASLFFSFLKQLTKRLKTRLQTRCSYKILSTSAEI